MPRVEPLEVRLTPSAGLVLAVPVVLRVNVADFGARGAAAGDDDDAPAIQAAIDAAPPGSTIVFPAGTYLIRSTLSVTTDGLTFQGAGGGAAPQSVIEQADGANLGRLFEAIDRQSITLIDLGFDGNRAGNSAAMNGLVALLGCTDTVVQDCEVRNSAGAAPHSAALIVGYSVSGQAPEQTTLVDNFIHDVGGPVGPSDAIYASGDDLTITHNRVVNATDTGIVWEAGSCDPNHPTTDARIDDNTILDTPQGIAVDAAKADSAGNSVVYLAGARIVGNLVDGSSARNQAGISVFTTLSGPAIHITGVTIAQNTVRHATAGKGIFLNGTAAVTVQANDVWDVSPTAGQAGIAALHCDATIIAENTVQGCGGSGISLQAATNATIADNQVTGNSLTQLAVYAGIFVGAAADGTPSAQVLITGNTSSGPAQGRGLVIGRASGDPTTDVTVENNIFLNNYYSFGYLDLAAGVVTFEANEV
jgi:parallel beta-helix repeat protein